jgi:hypothetical protein
VPTVSVTDDAPTARPSSFSLAVSLSSQSLSLSGVMPSGSSVALMAAARQQLRHGVGGVYLVPNAVSVVIEHGGSVGVAT